MRPALSLLLFALLPYSSGKSVCRCLSYQPCWPSASEFAQLESRLSKPLIKPTPPASACYPPSHPSGDCAAVQKHLSDGLWRSNLPGSMQLFNVESYIFKNGTIDACYYNTTLGVPCHQGNIPILGVEARSVSDVQATVKFANQHNLKLIIKNTGHDFLGRSAGRGGFMLWTHNLKGISYDDHFILEGDPTNQLHKAITFGAGVQWLEAYAAAKTNGRLIVGGISPGNSVGAAGGWVLGGGHSALSPKYGLGVDNAIQFTVVLGRGEYVTANQYRNPNLFWALRGGGGGTFGVIINVTYRTHDISPMTLASMNATFSTPETAQKVVTEFIKLHPTLSDAGWGGYSGWSNSSFSATYLATDVSLTQANATFSLFFDYAKSVDTHKFTAALYPLDSFYEFNALFNIPGGSSALLEFTSRFMSCKKALDEPAKVAQLTLAVGVSFLFVAGGAVARVNPDAVGVNPAWREALGVLTGGASWDEGTSAAEIERLRQAALDQLNQYLDGVSPNSGTYFNEASLHEKDFKKSFFGSHYDPLKRIKSEYDPDELFLVAEGVGSDDWDKSLNCRLY